MTWTVYQHYLPQTGQSYIGITSQQPPEKRWKNGNGYKGQRFYYAIKKYGWDAFDHIIVASGLTKKAAEAMEKELIKEFKTQNPKYGWNVAAGGISIPYWKFKRKR